MSNSRGSIQVVVSPNGSDDGKLSAADHQSAGMSSATTKMMNSPKVGPAGGQCLCSPTTHQGSFRCRFHRSVSSSWMMKRSKSMPAKSSAASIISPKSVEST